ncbi:hypothetical protein AVEN_182720-1 [Araneus ventricosus]|uniref:Uncharacterized protein n=1 Tax=Araneus ventricosus TaxID=182803 RepID=A0A4Y2JZC7_ARAVE|nr:hypothetical protein AVEN_182720-1 [Araneus ventricosus]
MLPTRIRLSSSRVERMLNRHAHKIAKPYLNLHTIGKNRGPGPQLRTLDRFRQCLCRTKAFDPSICHQGSPATPTFEIYRKIKLAQSPQPLQPPIYFAKVTSVTRLLILRGNSWSPKAAKYVLIFTYIYEAYEVRSKKILQFDLHMWMNPHVSDLLDGGATVIT